jgi:phosphatidylcholine synthase
MPTGTAKRGRIAAWLVHAYTASGAVLAFIGLDAVASGHARRAFAAMFVATFVDATDGALARRARVRDVLPGIDGARIDDLVDYLTFVVLPILLAVRFGLLPPGWGLAVAAVVLLSSVYGFVAPDAKTEDHFFTGFPSYWNIVILYLYVFGTAPALNASILLALSGLIFVRVGYVYPSRTPELRWLTLTLALVWACALGLVVWRLPSASPRLAILSLGFPVYYIVLSFVLQSRRTR